MNYNTGYTSSCIFGADVHLNGTILHFPAPQLGKNVQKKTVNGPDSFNQKVIGIS